MSIDSAALSPAAPRSRWHALLALVRPAQWPKNLLTVPLVLLTVPQVSPAALVRLAWIVAVFVLASALTYVFNDLNDRDRDRAHPAKRSRPIASREVSVPEAVGLALLLAGALGLVVALGPWQRAWPVGVYLALNLAYSCGLKHWALIEVVTVSYGFVLRLLAGCIAVGGIVSGWLTLTVFTGGLLLSLGKRRHELLLGPSKGHHRPVLANYTVQLLDHLMLLCAGLVVMAALMFFHDGLGALHERSVMVLSAPFALLLVFRYLQVVFVGNEGAEPSRLLLRDSTLICTAGLWLLLLLCLRMVEPSGVVRLVEVKQ